MTKNEMKSKCNNCNYNVNGWCKSLKTNKIDDKISLCKEQKDIAIKEEYQYVYDMSLEDLREEFITLREYFLGKCRENTLLYEEISRLKYSSTKN